MLRRFLIEEAAQKLSAFLNREAVFKRICGLYDNSSQYGNISDVTEGEWLGAEESRRFYRFGEYEAVRDECQSSANFTTFQGFLTLIRTTQFKIFVECISGLSFGPTPLINAYSYGTGDFLALHSDNVKDKRMSFVFYLTPSWERRFGGVLHMAGTQDATLEIEPEYNSLAIFDVTARTEHHITPVETCAGALTRATISGWFMTPEVD